MSKKIELAREKLRALPIDQKVELARRGNVDVINLLLDEKQPAIYGAVIDNPQVNENHLLHIVRDIVTPGEVMAKVAENHVWMRSYKMQMEVIKHPHTPIALAIGLVRNQGMTELMGLLGTQNLQPGLRQRMFDLFRQKVTQMGEVQRVSLLGRVPPDAAQIIIDLGGEKVLTEAIRNNHLRQYSAMRIARSSQSSPKILTLLFDTPPWGQQYEVRWALINNDNTPPDVKLKIHRTLSQADKQRLRKNKRLTGLY